MKPHKWIFGIVGIVLLIAAIISIRGELGGKAGSSINKGDESAYGSGQKDKSSGAFPSSGSFSGPESAGAARKDAEPIKAALNPREWQAAGAFKNAQGEVILKHGSGNPYYEGEYARATVQPKNGDQTYQLEVNQIGEYPRVYVDANEPVKMRMEFPSHPQGAKILVAAQDGGRMDGGAVAAPYTLDEKHGADFTFTASQYNGIHRVKVTSPSGETKLFDFWVGNEQVLAPR